MIKLTHNQIKELHNKSRVYLDKLCVKIPKRQVGSQGNRDATDFFAEVVSGFGFDVECPQFNCLDWIGESASLSVGTDEFTIIPGPYSVGGVVNAPLVVVSSIEELEAAEITGKVLLMIGEVAKEQLMPKNFPFYNPEEHQLIYRFLESMQPEAVIAATSKNWQLAAALYPFPLIEDGDFDIPSAYMKDVDGERLLEFAGQIVSLNIRAERFPATGCNVIARIGKLTDKRVVIMAHIDSRLDTPGALDNGTGVVVLLLLAEMLSDYDGDLGVELVAVNGEDYYAASGEIAWVESNRSRFSEIVIGVNIDAAGYKVGKTAFSFYECPEAIINLVRNVFAKHEGMVEGEPWYQSDHSLFIQNGRPALAITSEQFNVLSGEIAHTDKDTPNQVDYQKIVEVAVGLAEVVIDLDNSIGSKIFI